MDQMLILYTVGAFILGFIVAWLIGRSGPRRQLAECEANTATLQRSLDERKNAAAKLESQTKDLQAQVASLTSASGDFKSQLAAAQEQLAAADAAAQELQSAVDQAKSDRLLLQAELDHTRSALSSTRDRALSLEADLAAINDLEKEEEEVVAATTAAVVITAEDNAALAAQIEQLRREVELANAAAARAAAVVKLNPVLTPAVREEYVGLAGDPDKVVRALFERDQAVSAAQATSEYLRRDLSTLSAAGAELATTLNRRNLEYDLLLKRLSDLAATEPSAAGVLAAGRALPAVSVSTLEQETAAQKTADWQQQIARLQEELDSLTTVKATLDSELEERNQKIEDLKQQLDELKAKLATADSAQEALNADLQARTGRLDDVMARVAALNGVLATVADDEDFKAAAAEPATTDAPAASGETESEATS